MIVYIHSANYFLAYNERKQKAKEIILKEQNKKIKKKNKNREKGKKKDRLAVTIDNIFLQVHWYSKGTGLSSRYVRS